MLLLPTHVNAKCNANAVPLMPAVKQKCRPKSAANPRRRCIIPQRKKALAHPMQMPTPNAMQHTPHKPLPKKRQSKSPPAQTNSSPKKGGGENLSQPPIHLQLSPLPHPPPPRHRPPQPTPTPPLPRHSLLLIPLPIPFLLNRHPHPRQLPLQPIKKLLRPRRRRRRPRRPRRPPRRQPPIFPHPKAPRNRAREPSPPPRRAGSAWCAVVFVSGGLGITIIRRRALGLGRREPLLRSRGGWGRGRTVVPERGLEIWIDEVGAGVGREGGPGGERLGARQGGWGEVWVGGAAAPALVVAAEARAWG